MPTSIELFHVEDLDFLLCMRKRLHVVKFNTDVHFFFVVDRMFEARFVDGASFKKLVEALKDFKEINLECDANGIRLKVMDECHVYLADMKLNNSYFEHYQCETPCNIGLNTETLTRIIRQAPNERALVLRRSEDSNQLRVESDEDVETGLRRAADMTLITVNGETLKLPDQTYHVDVEIPTKLFSHMIKDLAGIGEDVTITITNKAIKFESDGLKGRVENVFHKGLGAFNGTFWRFDSTLGALKVEQAFAIRFLNGFSKACPLSESAILSMSAGAPLRLQFPLGDDSYLSYYIAPALD